MNTNEKISTFAAFCELITEYALNNEDFLLLTTEEVTETELFDRLPPEKYIRTESSVAGALTRAAGSAIAGKKTWLLGRVAELTGCGYAQIREAIALPKLPVRIAALNGGLSCAHEGASVQLLEDLALMRTIPNMNAVSYTHLPAAGKRRYLGLYRAGGEYGQGRSLCDPGEGHASRGAYRWLLFQCRRASSLSCQPNVC